MLARTWGRRGPRGMLGAVLAVIAIEAAFARHDLDLSRPENQGWRWGRSAARRSAPKADILCFGTSMVQTGVLPRVIAKRTGRPAFGMAVYASEMPYSYYLFKQVLASGGEPSALIIDFPVNFLGSSLDTEASAWPDALNLRDTFDMAWARGDARFFAAVASEKLLASMAYRLQVRKAVLAALQGESASLARESLSYARNHNQNHGAFLAGKKPGYSGEISEGYRNAFLSAHWRPDPVKVRYFRRLIELAAANGVRVYWVISPFVPSLQTARDAKRLDAPYDKFAWAMTSKFPNLTVLDARHSGYAHSVFMDAIHLDIDGAAAFSRSIAEAINLDAPTQWVHLPKYRDTPVDAPFELAVDSALAVRSGAALRR